VKNIQTVVIAADQIETQIDAAAAVALAQDAHLDVVCLGLDHSDISYGQAGSFLSMVQVGVMRATEEATDLRLAVEARLAAQSAPTLRWSAEQLVTMGGMLGFTLQPRLQLADLVVLQRPSACLRQGDAAAVLESALLDAAAPVMVVAAGQNVRAAAVPRRVVIAWNRSNEAMSAIRAALPLLKAATEVSIAVVDPGASSDTAPEPGAHLSTMLARHGIGVSVTVLPRTVPSVSAVLSRHLTDFDADLLVMGAYGHSRLREALFGGATKDMLDACPIPVLMAH
jgi:nucleotide-binding universal stress UspA family protein